MDLLAVTVFGQDRPGIVADTTAALAAAGGNLEDSTMTLLGGRFAMLLLVRTPGGPGRVRDALAGLTADGRLSVDVRAVPEPAGGAAGGPAASRATADGPVASGATADGPAGGGATADGPAGGGATADGPVTGGPGSGAGYLLSVHGADRPGIVSALTSVVARGGGNVTDLTTRLSGGLYVLTADVRLPGSADVGRIDSELRRTADGLGVDVSLRRVEVDDL
jgi:glycine cleavage system transcriptional repressor